MAFQRTPSSRKRRSKNYRSASVDSIISPETKRGAGNRVGASHRLRHHQSGRSIDRGEISHVVPQTRSRESNAEYARRARSGRHLSSRIGLGAALSPKRLLALAGAIALVILIIYLAASAAYSNSVSAKMALNDDQVSAALTKPESDTAVSYTLIAANLKASNQSGATGSSTLMLARLDPAGPKVSLLAIPGNLATSASPSNSGTIGGDLAGGNDAALIRSVSDLTGVDIAHYVKTDKAGLVSIVDALGGVEVNVDQEVDDPEVGSLYIPAGKQTLNGNQAATFAAASNYANGSTHRAKNNLVLLNAVAKAALVRGGLDKVSMLDSIACAIKTDYTSDELKKLLGDFASYDVNSTIICVMPGSDSAADAGTGRLFYSSSAWDQVKTAFEAGEDPAVQQEEKLAQVDPSVYSVKVLNGCGETGSASGVKKALKKAGYHIKGTGNAEQFVYKETLVIYKNPKDKTAAEAIARTLGTGRAVSASIYYSFNTDIEVIVGSDWSGSAS